MRTLDSQGSVSRYYDNSISCQFMECYVYDPEICIKLSHLIFEGIHRAIRNNAGIVSGRWSNWADVQLKLAMKMCGSNLNSSLVASPIGYLHVAVSSI